MSNHLGNVLTVVSDRKIPHSSNGTAIDYYLADVQSASDYSAFGVKLYGRGFEFSGYRYGFNGHEKDFEIKGDGNSYDFGARMYDPRLGRFLSVDPKTKEYADWSPYLVAGNNPILLVDINGEGVGDKFKTPAEAAVDWGQTYNGKSIRKGKEFASTIFKVEKDGEIYYTYNRARKGSMDGSTPRGAPRGTTAVADVHSHGAYSTAYDNTDGKNPSEPKVDFNNVFSGDDIVSNSKDNIDGYVVTPNGSVLFNNNKSTQSSNGVTTINTRMQSDPNDPGRKNDISPQGDYNTALSESESHNFHTENVDATGAPFENGKPETYNFDSGSSENSTNNSPTSDQPH